ncbi:H+transporting two-sector ATPase E subunit [Methanosalsum zhilinae DSM 4017]|uniref:A-type ATP synthase subunit E n=1 Tax=Methanosalsum zhilinae (strain DSM 4017 / NBRC 107636 / OCM 62 / WeN5) TaxID=679901 RepID=F7XP29_METZD|nr:V-type ATP synthase subunit E [Methanosalsum zhilinae]AEH61321.1 H+transporting two-sector ATPase E subunit [Methanosalsum zhilinae DSM 4017]
MGLEPVINDIMDASNKEVNRINSEADREVARILDEARQTAKKLRGDRLVKVEEDIENLRKQELSSAKLDVKRIILNVKKEMPDEVYDKALNSLSQLPPSKNEEYLKTILKGEEKNGTKVYSNKDSETLVKKLTSLEYAGNIDCIGGVIIENEDGTVRLDYTYESILKEVNERSLKEISDILFG